MRPQALLHGKRVYVHVAEAAKKGPSTGNGGPLRRLVTALGGKVKAYTVPCGCCQRLMCHTSASYGGIVSKRNIAGLCVDNMLLIALCTRKCYLPCM